MEPGRFAVMNRKAAGLLAFAIGATLACAEENPGGESMGEAGNQDAPPLTPEEELAILREAGRSLHGVEVQLSAHCCDAPATDANLISEVLSRSVDENVEFPAIESSATTQPVIDADVDISDTAIVITYRGQIQAETGSFNGYLFRLNAERPFILDTWLDVETNTPEEAVTLSSTEQSLSVNVAGLSVDAGSRIAIRLELGNEPSSGAAAP